MSSPFWRAVEELQRRLDAIEERLTALEEKRGPGRPKRVEMPEKAEKAE